MICNAKTQGLTLAEVLIALGIIGIVATMTISPILNKTQDMELKVALKKGYSNLSQAITQFKVEGYDLSTMDIGFSGATDNATFETELKKYYIKSKVCTTLCVPTGGTTYANYIGGTADNTWFNGLQFITADGMIIMLDDYRRIISIDVNGYLKPPNRLGKDLFMFQLVGDRILPIGSNGTSLSGFSFNGQISGLGNYCSKHIDYNRNGFACGFVLLNDQDIPD